LSATASERIKDTNRAIQIAPMLEPNSALPWQRALTSGRVNARKHYQTALGEALSLGNELGASLGTCFTFT
jgi:hypothetical protein